MADHSKDNVPTFAFDEVFDDDYVYFYEDDGSTSRADRETQLIWRLAALQPGAEVLDLACGYGRITNRLAGLGASVTGLDRSELFIDLARKKAQATGLDVNYIVDDMRTITFNERFDAIVIWYTAFGYFSDADNADVLCRCHAALKPGGRLLIDQTHRNHLLSKSLPPIIDRRGDDMMLDESVFDPLSDRVLTDRTIVRNGIVRNTSYFVRLYGYPELAEILRGCGFASSDVFGGDGERLAMRHGHMITVATR